MLKSGLKVWRGMSTLRRSAVYLLAGGMAALLAGCAGDPIAHADGMAQPAGMQREELQAGIFRPPAFVRITRRDAPLTVYIEGDGRAWSSRYMASTDPTPYRALGLSLAVADRSPNVLYLAQPCQFTPMGSNPRCNVNYWTGKRYAEEVVASLNAAIEHYLARTPGQRLNLVGYSGGGGLAALIAERRHDVASLRTVAGNLDHAAVNRLHEVSQMPDSLNAMDGVARLRNIPQLHISGADDSVVPPVIARAFVAAVGVCARQQVVNGMSHESDWAARWPQLLAEPLPSSSSCQ